MMHKANVPTKLHYLLWHEAFKTATFLDGLIPITISDETKTRDEHWGSTSQVLLQPLHMG